MAATGPIATFGAPTGGSGYSIGTFHNVPLTGGNGSGATATLTVIVGGAVSAVALPQASSHQQIDRTGKNYQVGDVLSAAASFDHVGGGSGFSVTVATLAAACENCFFGKIIPSTAGGLAGLRYCGKESVLNLQRLPSVNSIWQDMIRDDDYWCGDGVDTVSLTSFSKGITQLPTQQAAGTISGNCLSTAGVAFFNVTETRMLAGMATVLQPATAAGATFLIAHGIVASTPIVGGGFQVQSGDGANFTGAESYYYICSVP